MSFITLSVTHKTTGEQSARVYKLNDDQIALYEMLVRDMVKKRGYDEAMASRMIQNAITRCLVGVAVDVDVDEDVRKGGQAMRNAFPRITDREIHALPEMGCPRPWVRGIIMRNDRNPAGHEVRVDFDRQQFTAFNNLLEGVWKAADGVDRDAAWIVASTLATACIAGIDVRKEGAPAYEACKNLYSRFLEAFQKVDREKMISLPRATTEDYIELNCKSGGIKK